MNKHPSDPYRPRLSGKIRAVLNIVAVNKGENIVPKCNSGRFYFFSESYNKYYSTIDRTTSPCGMSKRVLPVMLSLW
jgi:hypothetical protein